MSSVGKRTNSNSQSVKRPYTEAEKVRLTWALVDPSVSTFKTRSGTQYYWTTRKKGMTKKQFRAEKKRLEDKKVDDDEEGAAEREWVHFLRTTSPALPFWRAAKPQAASAVNDDNDDDDVHSSAMDIIKPVEEEPKKQESFDFYKWLTPQLEKQQKMDNPHEEVLKEHAMELARKKGFEAIAENAKRQEAASAPALVAPVPVAPAPHSMMEISKEVPSRFDPFHAEQNSRPSYKEWKKMAEDIAMEAKKERKERQERMEEEMKKMDMEREKKESPEKRELNHQRIEERVDEILKYVTPNVYASRVLRRQGIVPRSPSPPSSSSSSSSQQSKVEKSAGELLEEEEEEEGIYPPPTSPPSFASANNSIMNAIKKLYEGFFKGKSN